MKRMLFALCLLAFAVAYVMGGGARVVDKTLYAEFATDTLGDTSTSIHLTPTSALDSFIYKDTFVVGPAYAESVVINWVSPLFMMTLTPQSTYGYDSMVYYDTIIFPSTARLGVSYTSPEYTYKVTPRAHNTYQYVDSIIFAADTYVATYTSDGSATVAEITSNMKDSINATTNLSDSVRAEDSTTYYVIRPIGPSHTFNRPDAISTDTAQTGAVSTATTLANVCDTLTKLINAETNLTDSITAQDSGTYVKLISNFGSDKFGGRWTHVCTDSTLDTAIHAGVNTTAMTCDSMAAKVNAEDTLSKYSTGANSGDTGWTVTSDDRGLDIKLFLADTATDTTRTQANVTSVSAITDTFSLAKFLIPLVGEGFRGSGLYGDIILQPASDTVWGFGASDSGYLWLLTGRIVDTGIVYVVLAKDSANSLPCTLHVAKIHAAANDTIFHNFLGLAWRVRDTLTDTVINAQYPVSVDLIVTDGY